MKKISTLFEKNPDNLALVIDKIDFNNMWVFTDPNVRATRKFDGTACAIIKGRLYKRYDVKVSKGRAVPPDAIPCQDPDPITGHWPHWFLCNPADPANRWHYEALKTMGKLPDGTYELCGPKVNGNMEEYTTHVLVPHGALTLEIAFKTWDYGMFKEYLRCHDIEGIVFHHPDGRMCKIRKSDFGIKRIKL